VNKDELILTRGEVDVHFQHSHFIARIFVQTDFSDSEDICAAKKFRDDSNDVFGELTSSDSFGLMQSQEKCGQTKFRGTFGFMFGKLAEIIVEAISRTAIESSQNAGSQIAWQPAVAIRT